MTKFLLAAIAVSIALPAAAAEEQRFTRDGATYVYTTETKGSTTTLSGRNLNTGAPFVLVLRDGKVSGTYNAVPVTFEAPASAAALSTQVASR